MSTAAPHPSPDALAAALHGKTIASAVVEPDGVHACLRTLVFTDGSRLVLSVTQRTRGSFAVEGTLLWPKAIRRRTNSQGDHA